MDYKDFFHTAAHAADQVIMQLDEAKLDQPTPCTSWNVQQLLNHMVNELAWVPELLAGKTVAEVGDALDGDLLGIDPLLAWRKHLQAATDSVNQATAEATVHLSYADVTARHYIIEIGGDLAIHTWDLAKAIGVAYHVPGELIPEIKSHLAPMLETMREYQMLAAQVAIADDADAETQLLADLGRSQAWAA